jgi:hypothetical protein
MRYIGICGCGWRTESFLTRAKAEWSLSWHRREAGCAHHPCTIEGPIAKERLT